MASGTSLVITFLDDEGAKRRFSFKYATPSAAPAQVKSAAEAIITNGSIFKNVPVVAKSAKMVVTTENEVDIS